jgi:hypothetical protein
MEGVETKASEASKMEKPILNRASEEDNNETRQETGKTMEGVENSHSEKETKASNSLDAGSKQIQGKETSHEMKADGKGERKRRRNSHSTDGDLASVQRSRRNRIGPVGEEPSEHALERPVRPFPRSISYGEISRSGANEDGQVEQQGEEDARKIRLNLDLEVELDLHAKIQGDVTLGLT